MTTDRPQRGNRFDEIQCRALDIAQHISSDPDIRQQVADDLIRLVGLMISSVGKSVACDGESDMNEPDDESEHAAAYARYRTGEDMQSGSDYTVTNATTPEVKLERWATDGREPLWKPVVDAEGSLIGWEV